MVVVIILILLMMSMYTDAGIEMERYVVLRLLI